MRSLRHCTMTCLLYAYCLETSDTFKMAWTPCKRQKQKYPTHPRKPNHIHIESRLNKPSLLSQPPLRERGRHSLCGNNLENTASSLAASLAHPRYTARRDPCTCWCAGAGPLCSSAFSQGRLALQCPRVASTSARGLGVVAAPSPGPP